MWTSNIWDCAVVAVVVYGVHLVVPRAAWAVVGGWPVVAVVLRLLRGKHRRGTQTQSLLISTGATVWWLWQPMGVRLGLLILWFWWIGADLGNRHAGDNGDLMALMIILMVMAMEMVFLMVMAMEMVLLLVMAMMAMMTVMAILVILGWFSHRRNSGRHTPGNAPRTSLSSSSSYSPRTTLGVNHCHHLQYYNKKMHPFTFLDPCLYF